MRITILALVATCLVACGSVSAPGARTAYDYAHDALNVAAALNANAPDVVRRLSIASSALDAVQHAQTTSDLKAAAPCAVDALRAVEPDLKSKTLKQALNVALAALEQVGGTCNVDGQRDDDAGVPD